MPILAVALFDWADDPWVGHAANVAQLAAVVLAIPAAFWAYKQLKVGASASESQAILALDEAFYRHDDLRKELNTAGGYKPEGNDTDNVRLRRYVAVFERLGFLLKMRVIRVQLADQLYGSRLEKLLTKNNGQLRPIVTERDGKGWENFLWMRKRLAKKMTHRDLPDPTQAMGADAVRSGSAEPERGGVPGDRGTLRFAYTEVCKSHQGIADFRAKLLALLPAASGAGIFLILSEETPKLGAAELAAIGLFGFAVTFGLFMYELRGIQHCHELRDQAARLEEKLEIPADCGQFRDRTHSRLRGLVGVEAASWLVYTAVLMSWLYVAVHGTDWRDELGIALLALYLVVIGFWLRSKRLRAAR